MFGGSDVFWREFAPQIKVAVVRVVPLTRDNKPANSTIFFSMCYVKL